MKFILCLLFLINTISFSSETICGKAVGFSYNKDSIERPYSLSGFFIKQNTRDIRITFGNSPELIENIENILKEGHHIFICLDNYELIFKTYASKKRVYGIVDGYRIWLNGELTDY